MSCDEIVISIQDQRRNNGDGAVPIHKAAGLVLASQPRHTINGLEFKRASVFRAIGHLPSRIHTVILRRNMIATIPFLVIPIMLRPQIRRDRLKQVTTSAYHCLG